MNQKIRIIYIELQRLLRHVYHNICLLKLGKRWKSVMPILSFRKKESILVLCRSFEFWVTVKETVSTVSADGITCVATDALFVTFTLIYQTIHFILSTLSEISRSFVVNVLIPKTPRPLSLSLSLSLSLAKRCYRQVFFQENT